MTSLTPDQETQVRAMRAQHLGIATIALRLKVNNGRIAKFLKANNLTRTREQAHELKKSTQRRDV